MKEIVISLESFVVYSIYMSNDWKYLFTNFQFNCFNIYFIFLIYLFSFGRIKSLFISIFTMFYRKYTGNIIQKIGVVNCIWLYWKWRLRRGWTGRIFVVGINDKSLFFIFILLIPFIFTMFKTMFGTIFRVIFGAVFVIIFLFIFIIRLIV